MEQSAKVNRLQVDVLKGGTESKSEQIPGGRVDGWSRVQK